MAEKRERLAAAVAGILAAPMALAMLCETHMLRKSPDSPQVPTQVHTFLVTT